MTTRPTNTDQAAQERMLQLLCLIAQSLRRIESQLGVAGITPQQRPNKIIAFRAEKRQ